MPKKKALIVEDEKELSHSICSYLANERSVCKTAATFTKTLEKISLYDYACIVPDIDLPNGNRPDLLKELKKVNKLWMVY